MIVAVGDHGKLPGCLRVAHGKNSYFKLSTATVVEILNRRVDRCQAGVLIVMISNFFPT